MGIREGFRFMGLVAVISGIAYALLHLLWLRKIQKQDGEEISETKDIAEPRFKDQGTMVSFERLSLVIEYNQIGSLTSLGRGPRDIMFRARSNSIRRGSYSSGMFHTTKDANSKIDLLKSAIEVNHHRSTSHTKISSNHQNTNSSGKV